MPAMRQTRPAAITRRNLLLLTVALLPPGLAAQVQPTPQAAAAGDEIEIIVFRRRHAGGDTPELPLPVSATAPAGTDGTYPAPPPDGATPAALPATALRLGGLVARLRSAGNYELLYHGGWTQAIATQSAARATPLPVETRQLGLQGTVTLYQERFLHALVDLQLDAAEPGLAPARIHQERRLRSQRLHYFDHPQFGVILEIRSAAAPLPATP